LEEAKGQVEAAARDAGRDPATLGMEGRITLAQQGIDQLDDVARQWREAGATHVGINTMNAGLPSIEDHLQVLKRCAEVLKLKRP
jgi:hypothetical protein